MICVWGVDPKGPACGLWQGDNEAPLRSPGLSEEREQTHGILDARGLQVLQNHTIMSL
jgi:hypothetical protein